MMKITSGSMVMFSFIVIVLSLNPLLVEPEAVLDITGEELRQVSKYYIISTIRGGGGGGVTLGRNRNGTLCPLDVVQEPSDLNNGLPVTFFPVDNSTNGVIQLETDLNIDFSAPNYCRESTVWKVDEFDEKRQKYFVTTRGVIGNPGPNTLSNWFRIEKLSSVFFKLVYCPSVCSTCKVECGEIGRFYDKNGVRRLAVGQSRYIVFFRKAEISTTSAYY